MHGEDMDDNAVFVNSVDETVLTVDAAGPHPCKRVFQGLWLADTSVRVQRNVGEQSLDPVHDFHITALDKGIVMSDCRVGKDYSEHVTRSKSSSIDSPSCWAVTRP